MKTKVSCLPHTLPPLSLSAYLIFPVFLLAFWIVLLVFDVLQRIALLFGKRAHEKIVLWLNRFLVATLRVFLRTKIVFQYPGELSSVSGLPCIIVSNHQSLFDIPILASGLERFRPRFVAKRELARWIPSVSLNLRRGGNAIIDRGNARQALGALSEFGHAIAREKTAAVIFPEGTRSRDGALGEFHQLGVQALVRAIGEVMIVPVTLDGTWRLSARRCGPVPVGLTVTVSVGHPFLVTTETDLKETLSRVRSDIEAHLKSSLPAT